jgi:hypothetical protein
MKMWNSTSLWVCPLLTVAKSSWIFLRELFSFFSSNSISEKCNKEKHCQNHKNHWFTETKFFNLRKKLGDYVGISEKINNERTIEYNHTPKSKYKKNFHIAHINSNMSQYNNIQEGIQIILEKHIFFIQFTQFRI